MTAPLFLPSGAILGCASALRSDLRALNAWTSTICDVLDRDDATFVALLSLLALAAALSNRFLARGRTR